MNSTNVKSAFPLTFWQQKQAAMLAYFSSLDYLITLHELVTQLINGNIEAVLDLAKLQGRDAVLVDERWGSRDTSQNWSDNAWPFLKNLQASLARDISERPHGKFKKTAVYEYFRGMDQFSLGWMTPDEEDAFDVARKNISNWAASLDLTMSDWTSNDWDDYGFAWDYPAFASRFDKIPRFRIRTDIVYPTGAIPEQTGIYISKDDPHAALQFAWSGKEGRKLRKATTFNDLGLAALAAVGREDLWFNDEKMFEFTTSPPYAELFREDVIWSDGPHPTLATSAVARRAFTKRDSDWYLVEPVEGEFDRLADLSTSTPLREDGPRIVGGEKCVEPGFYFSPSRTNSRRYFAKGELAPVLGSQYGETYWQWDLNQE
jgi:hypothetical protein